MALSIPKGIPKKYIPKPDAIAADAGWRQYQAFNRGKRLNAAKMLQEQLAAPVKAIASGEAPLQGAVLPPVQGPPLPPSAPGVPTMRYAGPVPAGQELALPTMTYQGPTPPNQALAPIAQGAEAAAGAAGGAAEAAAPWARSGRFASLGNMLAQTPLNAGAKTAATEALASGAAPGILSAGGALGPGSLGRASAYGIGGQVLGNIAANAIGPEHGNVDDVVRNALSWGGAGASLGSMILPGWGTAIGGIGAGLAGGLYGMFTGDESPKNELGSYLNDRTTELSKQLQGVNLDDDAKKSLMTQLQLIGLTAENKDEAKTLYKNMMANTLPTLMSESEARQKRQNMMMMTQSWLAPLISKQVNQSNMLAGQWGQQATKAAGYVRDPELRALAQSQAAQLQSQVSQGNLGYLQQLAATPALYGYNAPQGMQNPTGQGSPDDLMAMLNATAA